MKLGGFSMSNISLTKLLNLGLLAGIAVIFSISGFDIWQTNTPTSLTIFVLLVGVIIGFTLMRYLKREFDQIALAVESIKYDNYKKIQTSGKDLKEFANLKEAINKMLDDVAESKKIIEDRNQEVLRQNTSLMEKSRELEEMNTELDASYEEAILSNEMLLQKSNELENANHEANILKDKYELLFVNSPDAYLIMEIDGGTISDCNKASEKMLRGERSQIIGSTPDKISPKYQPDGKTSAEAAAEKIVESLRDGSNEFEWVHRRLDGTNFWAHVTISLVMLDGRNVLFVAWRDISDVKKLHDTLSNERKRYATMMEHSSDAIFIMDSDGRLIEFSEQAKELLGYTDEEMKNLNVIDWDAMIPKDELSAMLKAALNTTTDFETKHRRKDGTIYDAHITTAGVELNGNKYIYSSTRDITDRKNLEKTLQKQKEEFETIFKTSKDGIAILDMETNFLDFNDAYLEMTGFTREELLTKSCLGLSVPDDFDHAAEALREVMEKGFLRDFEKTCIVKDGKKITINMSISLMPDKQRLLISTKDITEQRQTKDALAQSENRLQNIIQMEPECVKIMNKNGLLTYMNPAGLGMIEADSFEQVSDTLVADIIAPEYRMDYVKLHERVIAGEKMTMQYEVLGLKGGRRWLETHAVPMQVGDKVMHLAVTRDISEHKAMEDQLEQLNAELIMKVEEETTKRLEKEKLLIQQSKMAMMGEMIGAIAHQWRQPLNSLGMTIQDVEMAYKFNELDEKYIVAFKKDAMAIIQSMSMTIEDFRNFFSPNKRQEEFFVEDAVNDILKIMASQLRINSVEVIFDSEKSDRHKYMGYKNELKQVLLNILANAKDALLEVKRDNSFIKIDIDDTDTTLTISIEDSAGGIPEDVIDKIFNPYFTTKSADKGTGIGLYMSKEIVEHSLNGKLGVMNTQNGARFAVELLKRQ
jgi:PAS domain S-box-containing protein